MNSTENNLIGTSKEHIQFKIDISYNYTLNAPEIKVCLNGISKFNQSLTGNNCSIKFDHLLEFGEAYCLEIYRAGKTDQDPDQMVLIDHITIDGVDIQNLIWTGSYYEPSYPALWYAQQISYGIVPEVQVLGETYLGHNGLWTLTFTSPFWQHLLNQMNL